LIIGIMQFVHFAFLWAEGVPPKVKSGIDSITHIAMTFGFDLQHVFMIKVTLGLVTIIVFVVVFILQDHIQWRALLNSKNSILSGGAWRYFYLGCAFYCSLVSGVLMIPLLNLLTRFVMQDAQKGAGSIALILFRDLSVVAIGSVYVMLSLRLVAAGGELDNVILAGKLCNSMWDAEATLARRKTKRVHPLVQHDKRYEQAAILIKIVMSVSMCTLETWKGMGMWQSVALAGLMALASLALLVVGILYDRFFSPNTLYEPALPGGYDPNKLQTGVNVLVSWQYIMQLLRVLHLVLYDGKQTATAFVELSLVGPFAALLGYAMPRRSRTWDYADLRDT